eukprot:gene10524-2651_t
MLGLTTRLHLLLQSDFSPKAKDSDGWTPLHYASWYGQDDIVRILMEDWRGAPAEITPNGATALHLAARNGHAEIVRLLVACPIVDANQQDGNGDTPLTLCKQAQINDWEDVIAILTNPEKFMHAVNRFGKLQLSTSLHDFRIHFLDDTVKVIRLPSVEVSSVDVRNATAAMLQLPEQLYDLFSIWAVSDFFEVELEKNANPVKQIERLGYHGGSKTTRLFFKKSGFVTLHEERQILSQVALKLLFDESLACVLSSRWPTNVEDAAHLAGLLMQIRFGDFNPSSHVIGFLRGALDTFIPQHLLHNQLKTIEWERRIFAQHKKHEGVTDVVSLHRLYLQYCRQWPYYGAIVFDGVLLKTSIRKKPDDVTVAINSDYISFIMKDTVSVKAYFSWDEFKHSIDQTSRRTSSSSKLDVLQPYLVPTVDTPQIIFVTDRIEQVEALATKMLDRHQRTDQDLEQKRVAQGGPRIHKLVSNQPAPVDALSRVERQAIEERQNKERFARYRIIHSFGVIATGRRGSEMKSTAEKIFEKHCTDENLASINDLKIICLELGYWLGPELDGARMILDSSGTNMFSFRDLVSWWSQSTRSWLYLLDEQAVKKRLEAVEIFLRNDRNRTGRVSDEKLSGLIKGLRSSGLTRKTEEAIRKGLDPNNTGFLPYNNYIDWMANMQIIDDRML